MKPLQILVGITSIRIPYGDLDEVDRYYVKQTLFDFCKKKLTTFEYVRFTKRFKKDREYYIHDSYGNQFKIPVPFIDEVLRYLKENYINYEIQSVGAIVKGEPISWTMKENMVERPHQVEAIKFLSENQSGRYGLELRTGDGKTFCSTKAMYNIGTKSIIICNGLVDQWERSLEEQTNLGEKRYTIQGISSIKKLLKSDLRPDCFVASISTIRPWVQRQGMYKTLPRFSEFIKLYGIGTKITDESHECFHASCMIDLEADVKKNIYLTATFLSNSSSTKAVFRKYYPNQMRYAGSAADKYTKAFFYSFSGMVPERRCSTIRGYSHSKYEQYLLSKPSLFLDWFYRVLSMLVQSHYANNKSFAGKKLLIFCFTIDMCKRICEGLQTEHPDLKIMTYVDTDPESNLVDADIIISTHKGCGTGRDIKGLKVVIDTVSYQSQIVAKQAFGRLRKPDDGITPEYIGLIDLNLGSHVRHWRERGPVIKDCAKDSFEYRI